MKSGWSKRIKRCFCFVMAAALAGSMVVESVYAQPAAQEFVERKTQEIMERKTYQDSEEISGKKVIDLEELSGIPNYGYVERKDRGEIESIYALPADEMGAMEEVVELPGQYTNRNLPNTRNQGAFGTCWAHAALAAAEANMMKKGILPQGKSEADTSELHLAYFAYHTTADPLGGISEDIRGSGEEHFLMQGGNTEQATRTLFAWLGAADEETAPYSDCGIAYDAGLNHSIAYEDIAHIKNAYLINPVEEREEAKRLVYEYGAITVSYLAMQNGDNFTYQGENYGFTDFYNKDNNAYYCPFSAMTNHAVTIVGWDDDFPKENFAIQPEGDGAWLIRNSWSTSNVQSHNGYFWISYYDKSLSYDSYAYEMDYADNYDNNYQYDGTFFSTSSYQDTCANVFKVKASEQGESLEAVAFETDNTNLDYIVEIYTQVEEGGTPDSGKLTAVQKGSTKYAGYHTVELEHPVALNYGENYAVVVKLIKEEYFIGVKCESTANAGGYVTIPRLEEGESFYYENGQWQDQYDVYGNVGNFCIKAFTKDMEERVEANDILLPGISSSGISIGVEEEYNVLAMALPVNAVDREVFYQSSNSNVVAVTEDGKLKGIQKGSAVITVTTTNGRSKSFSVTVKEKVNSLKIRGEERLDIGKRYTFTASWEPAYVTPNGSIRWSSDDSSVICIDENTGEVTATGVGRTYIRAELDGIFDALQVEVRADIYSCNFKIEADRDSVVNITWKAVEGAKEYSLQSGGRILATFTDDGRESYSYQDTTYQGSKQIQVVDYSFIVIDNLGSIGRFYDIWVGPANKVTYVIAHGKNNEENPSYYREGESYYLKDPVADPGYYFEQWYADEDYIEYVWSISEWDWEDLTFYAKMLPISYSVKYHSNDSTNVAETVNAVYDREITLANNRFSRAGYEFVGWNTKADGTGTSYEGGQMVSNLTTRRNDTVILYAQWKAKEYEITFDANEGTVSQDKKTVAYEKTYGELPAAGREGYDFLGWFTKREGGQKVTESDVFRNTEDITLYARWEKSSYTVTFHAGEGEIVGGSESKSVYANMPYGELPTARRTGYRFTGWFLNHQGVEQEITSESIVMIARNHELTAGWEEIIITPCKVPAVSIAGEIKEGVLGESDWVVVSAGAEIILTGDDRDTLYYAFVNDAGVVIGEYREYTESIPVIGEIRIAVYADRPQEEVFGPSEVVVFGFKEEIPQEPEEPREPEEPQEPEGFRVEGLEQAYPYTGSVIKPGFKVFDGKQELVEKRDYKVIYKNNKKAGYATVKIKGLGNYKGEMETGFEILPMDIKGEDFSADSMAVIYNKKEQKPVPVLYFGTKKLLAKKDYFIEYYRTEFTQSGYQKVGEAMASVKEPGNYKLCLVGTGNYTGRREVGLSVNSAETVLISKVKISKPANEIYTGDEICPKPVVKYKNTLLNEKEHYTLSYYNNKDIGTATVVIRGIEEHGFSGTKRINFVIKGNVLKKQNIKNLQSSYEYMGKAIEPFGAAGNPNDLGQAYLEDTKGNGETPVKLVKGTDYEVVSYRNHLNAGTASVVLKGINGYSGMLTLKYKIKPATADEKEVVVTYDDRTAYAKGGAKPTISKVAINLMDENGNSLTQSLVEGRDYTISYAGNKNVTTDTTAKLPEFTLKGKGNYKGILAKESFTIIPQELSVMEIVAKDKVYTGKANTYKTGLTITDSVSGKKLSGKDYDTNLKYYYDADTIVSVKEKKDTVTMIRTKDSEVQKEDIIPAGTTLRIETCGKNSYHGNIVAKYRIVEGDFTKAKVKIKDKEYTGGKITLTKDDIISVTINGISLESSEYRIAGYSNNINKGKATVILEGLDHYGGRKSVTFKIRQRPMLFGWF